MKSLALCFIALNISCGVDRNEKPSFNSANKLNREHTISPEKIHNSDAVRKLSSSECYSLIERGKLRFDTIKLEQVFNKVSENRKKIEEGNFDLTRRNDLIEASKYFFRNEDILYYNEKHKILKINKQKNGKLEVFLVPDGDYVFCYFKDLVKDYLRSGIFIDNSIIIFHTPPFANGEIDYFTDVSSVSYINLEKKEMLHMDYLDRHNFDNIFICDFSKSSYSFFQTTQAREKALNGKLPSKNISLNFYFDALRLYDDLALKRIEGNKNHHVIDIINFLINK